MKGLSLQTFPVRAEARPDGSTLLDCAAQLPSHDPRAAAAAMHWAAVDPGRLALADRRGDPAGWRTLTYGDLQDRSARLGQAFLDAGLGPDRPVMLVSENRIEAALVILAAERAGVPVAPVTPAYSAGKGDPGRLGTVIETLKPGLIIAESLAIHGQALSALRPDGSRLVGISGEGANFDVLLSAQPGPGFTAAEAAVTGDTVAKILFTSGSTGTPKGAINTHRMLTSAYQSLRAGWPFLDEEPPVVVDWLPWSHTFGGNFVFNAALSSGGVLHVDDGKPFPHLIGRSVANAAEIHPTIHVNAPRGLDMVARILAADDGLADAFFERLGMVFFASAGLPARIRDEWLKLIDRHARRPVAFCSAWGTTETAPLATSLNFDAAQVNNIGTPAPGVTLKLAPFGGRHELRVKGPNVSPGYLNKPDLTAAAFDEDGFFRTGDVGRLADPARPELGVLIEGRIAEDFKLTSGVWVNVNGVRAQLLEIAGPIVRDVVLSGPNRDELVALVFLDTEAAQKHAGAASAGMELATHPAVIERVREIFDRHNQANATSSRAIARYLIMARTLEPAAGELTEKGTVNQRAVLAREAQACNDLHEALAPAGR